MILSLAALVAVIAIGRLVGEPPPVLEDEQAAGFADHGLLTAISSVAVAPDGADAVTEALTRGVTAGRQNESPYGWSVLSREGDVISVAAYYHWGDASPLNFRTGPERGRACRLYDLRTSPVVAHAMACPGDSPDRPGS
ncbi:hypothetical protein OVA26_09215 [Microbacterium sp. SL62]|uniref:hypothetical protein n=1 Tax=Microbacterium sp. SL62 TaxID=2995139 RepID=UPI00227520E2|nr:hypothetical protein [Microbacterium sp. SL62]MCY1717133.1 hypothetical protein [Microbacterium sp. SL62]